MTGFLVAAAGLMGYYLLALVAVPLTLRAWRGVPDELVRKLQHLGYGGSIWVLLALFGRWHDALAASALLVVVAYPALLLLERWRGYTRTFPDRAPERGELRRSLLWVQASFAANVALFWGLGGDAGRTALAAGVMAWTLGDAVAAGVGRTLGRHAARGRFLAGDKTAEGTTAMALSAGVAVSLTVGLFGDAGAWLALATGLVAGPVAAAVELYSPHGTDTLTVPAAAASAVWITTAVAGWLAPRLPAIAMGA